ncbi:MAG: S41 family peptidase [Kofleriaceae bacterium]
MLLVGRAATAQPEEPLPTATDRVIELGRAWARAKFFHPTLATRAIDWDAALVAAIPKVEAANTVGEYRAAVAAMFTVLNDPVTCVVEPTPSAPTTAVSQNVHASLTQPSPGVLYVRLAPITDGGFDIGAFAKHGIAVEAAVAKVKAKVLLIDLRGANLWLASNVLQGMGAVLPGVDEWPIERTLEHHGYRTQQGMTSGSYFSSFVTTGAEPPRAAGRATVAHVVWIVGGAEGVPADARGMQAAGRGSIVSLGPLSERSTITTASVSIGAGLTVSIRVGESTWGAPRADLTIAKEVDLLPRAQAFARAVASGRKRAARKRAVLPELVVRNDLDYATTPYPSREHRMLAGIRVWATLDTFSPYRYLINDWDGALRAMLPRLVAARDAKEYRWALQELGVRAGDGHINVTGGTFDPGAPKRGTPAVRLRVVEGKVAVVATFDNRFVVGDVIETIDGKPVAAALAALAPRVSGSTAEAKAQEVAEGVLVGDDGSRAKVGLRGADGKLREITALRESANSERLAAAPTTPHWKLLANNIGYADLTQLKLPEVGPMFEAFKATRAIVFDLRGYPNETAWAIAPRINTKGAQFGAQFATPLVTGDDTSRGIGQALRYFQPLPALQATAPLYRGTIVVLIDDRAISQAEHTCLFFAQAAAATFVGSPTHGANGDVTVMRLPGGLRMSFTGQEVRDVDGRQLQQVGIQPHVLVRPTLAGLRTGKDEVLARAAGWLATDQGSALLIAPAIVRP